MTTLSVTDLRELAELLEDLDRVDDETPFEAHISRRLTLLRRVVSDAYHARLREETR